MAAGGGCPGGRRVTLGRHNVSPRGTAAGLVAGWLGGWLGVSLCAAADLQLLSRAGTFSPAGRHYENK